MSHQIPKKDQLTDVRGQDSKQYTLFFTVYQNRISKTNPEISKEDTLIKIQKK